MSGIPLYGDDTPSRFGEVERLRAHYGWTAFLGDDCEHEALAAEAWAYEHGYDPEGEEGE